MTMVTLHKLLVIKKSLSRVLLYHNITIMYIYV